MFWIYNNDLSVGVKTKRDAYDKHGEYTVTTKALSPKGKEYPGAECSYKINVKSPCEDIKV